MIPKLLAAILLMTPAVSIGAEGAAVRGCCQRPMENPPRAPQKRALCSGNMWSLAQPGRCLPGVGDEAVCREGAFSTLVMVREYSLSWDDRLKQCVLVSSGRSWPTVVATCDGNSC